MKKSRKRILALCVLITLSGVLFFKNAEDKNALRDSYAGYSQNPRNFRFEHFGQGSRAMANALKKIIPKGSSKTYVDSILVEAAGAKVRHELNGHSVYIKRRSISNLNPDIVNINFDGKDVSTSLIYAGEVIY